MTPLKVFAVVSLLSFLQSCAADYKDYRPNWANELIFPNQFPTNKRVPEQRGPYDLRSMTLLTRLAQVAKRIDPVQFELHSKFSLYVYYEYYSFILIQNL